MVFLLSILAVLNNVVVWMVSTRPPTYKSSSPFSNHLVTVPNAPITIGKIVTFMFQSLFNSIARSRYLSFFSHSFSFILGHQIRKFCIISFLLFFFLLIIIKFFFVFLVRWQGLFIFSFSLIPIYGLLKLQNLLDEKFFISCHYCNSSEFYSPAVTSLQDSSQDSGRS